MQIFDCVNSDKRKILALGAESAGNFSFFNGEKIFYSADFGDLLAESNFVVFQKAVLDFLKKQAATPDVILTDLHPLMKTTLWGQQLAKKYKAAHIQVQHHHAHIFSAIGEQSLQTTRLDSRRPLVDPPWIDEAGARRENYPPRLAEATARRCEAGKPQASFGIALDGTGYGEDERIWGGEVFEISKSEIRNPKQIQNSKSETPNGNIRIQRIGQLENQTLLGGELAIQEPARMIISILSKFLSKKEAYHYVRKYYSTQEFEVLHNQLQQNFNCLETSSAGRILDAVSLLLGFCENVRNYKHAAIDLLEKNSTEPYTDLKPKIIQDVSGKCILDTTYLFNYVIKYLHKDKHRLAATAQLYLAQGLYEIIKKNHPLPLSLGKGEMSEGQRGFAIFAGGGIASTKIISQYLALKNIYLNKKIPRGDAGLSFGQMAYFLSHDNL